MAGGHGGFSYGQLVLLGLLSFGCLLLQDGALEPIDVLGEVLGKLYEANPMVQGLQGTSGGSLLWEWSFFGAMGLMIAITWMAWGGIFYRYYHNAEVESWSRVWLRRVLKGSVLELLIAVPTHVVVRAREECCAPAVSFMGIVTGLSVMLLCFGPGVIFLYLDRARRLRARKPDPEPPVDAAPTQT